VWIAVVWIALVWIAVMGVAVVWIAVMGTVSRGGVTATDAGAGEGSGPAEGRLAGRSVERPFDTIEHEHPFDVKAPIERVFAPTVEGV
jgi:hypothetical protein